jgi:glycosyltransferase involved in cell wall biosynthesis
MTAVSIIIPTYNRAVSLSKAIQSVLNQTWTDYELIVVDDGSTDDTAAVVAHIDDRRVHYLQSEHVERSAARNIGLSAATGEFIAFLDDDDQFLPHRLAYQVTYLNAHREVDVVASGIYLQREGESRRTAWSVGRKDEEVTLPACFRGKRPSLFACLFHRSLLDRMDQWFDLDLILVEDVDFVLRLILTSKQRAMWLPGLIYVYQMRRNCPSMDVKQLEPKLRLVLDKFFARSDLPPEIISQRMEIYIWQDVVAACVAYSTEQPQLAQFILLKGLIRHPALVTKGPDIVLNYLVAWVNVNSEVSVNHKRLVDQVFDHLPTPLQSWQVYRDIALDKMRAAELLKAPNVTG